MSEYAVWLTDQTFQVRTAQIDRFKRMEFNQRFNDVGKFLLEMPYDQAAQYVGYGAGISVERDGVVIYNGFVNRWRRVWNSRENYFELSGADENSILENALALPVPLGPPYTTAEFDERTGIAGSLMIAYVENNVGASARSDRRRITTAPDYAYGVTLTEQARFERLIDVLNRLAVAGGGLGFRIRNGLFEVYLPETKAVTFSTELGNMKGYEYSVEAATGNYFVVGGTGEGTARSFWEAPDSLSITRFGRREQFLNRTDIDDDVKAFTAIGEALGKNADKTPIKITVGETDATQYLRDYNLGDTVRVEVDNIKLTDVVREVTIKLNDKTGESLDVVIGSASTSRMDAISNSLAGIKNISQRVSRLESYK